MRRGTIVILVWSTFALTVFLTISCQRTPEFVAEGEVCERCRRIITNKHVAGEILQGPVMMKYKTPACMAQYVLDHPDTRDADIFVTDYPTGALIRVETAYFVPASINDVTGERDYRAYYARRVAEAAAAERNTGALRWGAVLHSVQAGTAK